MTEYVKLKQSFIALFRDHGLVTSHTQLQNLLDGGFEEVTGKYSDKTLYIGSDINILALPIEECEIFEK